MSKKKMQSMIPQLDLKGDEYAKFVPDEQRLDLTVQFKYKARKEAYDNVKAFALQGGKFKIVLRGNEDTVNVFNAKELKTVYVHFDPFANIDVQIDN